MAYVLSQIRSLMTSRMSASSEIYLSRLEGLLSRQRRKYQYLLLLLVVVLSFLYGLINGFNRQDGIALASEGAFLSRSSYSGENEELLALLSKESLLRPVGQQVVLAGGPASVYSVLSNGGVKDFLRNLSSRMEQQGWETAGATSSQRGALTAYNRQKEARLTLLAWAVPISMRARISSGYSIQGTLSVSRGSSQSSSEFRSVPGVPIYPGAKVSGVFRSFEYGIEAFSAVYRVPASLEDTVVYYRESLLGADWQKRWMMGNTFIFERDKQELSLVFSRSDQTSVSGVGETFIIVGLGPKLDRN